MIRWFRHSNILPARREHANPWPLLVGTALAVWLVYAFWSGTLSLPFFEDDFVHLRWLQTHSLVDPFLTAESLPTYRPLGESLLKLWFLLQGRHDPVWLRFQNIAFAVVDVVLTARLVVEIDRSRRRFQSGALAALFFAALPFAYQAIPWINVFFYPLETLLLLSTAYTYWKARVSGRLSWLLLAFFLCFLSPFEIEQGLLANLILLTVEAILWLQKRQSYPWLGGPLIGGLLNVAFFVIWQRVPKFEYSFGLPTVERLYVILVYFLQGLIYPVAPLAHLLETRLGWHDLETLLVLSLLTIGLLVAVLWRRRPALAVLSLVWFVAFSLTPGLMVTAEYVVNSPRLLYLVGPAIGWLWGGALVEWWHAGRRYRPAVLLILLFTLAYSTLFVAHKHWLYRLGTAPIVEVGHIVQAVEQPPENGAPAGVLLVNLPAWLAATDQYYALGSHGVQLIPAWVNIQDVVYAQTGTFYPATAVRFDETNSPQPGTYWHSPYGPAVDRWQMRDLLLTHGQVWVTDYQAERIDLRLVGRVTGLAWEGATVVFSDALALGAVHTTIAGDELFLDLTWQVLTDSQPADLTVFVHLVGPDGQLRAQADRYPLEGLAPFWLWDQGQLIGDRRCLPWSAEWPAGAYQLAVGVYDRASGERIPAYTPSGARVPDDWPVAAIVERTP